MNNTLPNFLIVGAPKTGTTSLYNYLAQHPQIFFSKIKEPFFLSFAEEKFKCKKNITPWLINNFEEYKKLFMYSGDYIARGEASTIYLYYHDKTIKNIKKYIPDYKKLKIIIILRNPIDRAYSHYMMHRKNNWENLSFREALQAEKERIINNYHFSYYYQEEGFYYNQVKAYLDNFKHVKIFLFEEVINNPLDVTKEIFSFLNVDSNFKPELGKKYNVSGEPKNKFINKIIYGNSILLKIFKYFLPKKFKFRITELYARVNLKKVPINHGDKKYLQKIFKNDVLKLEKLIKKNLTHWLND